MNQIGTISGIQAVFGARWDDAKDQARFKTSFAGTTGFYDDKDIDTKAVPAPAIVHQMLEVEDAMAAYVVFYHDDEGEIFGSVVFSAGQVAPLSEMIYESYVEWQDAIIRATNDSNVDLVFFPEGAVDFSDDKHRPYEVDGEKVDQKALPGLSPASNLKMILAVIAMLLVLSAIPIGAWIIVAKPFEKATNDVQFVIEKVKPDYAQVLDQCAVDLEEPWPAPPEWTLRQEGCVVAPELAKINFPKPADQRPYAYRFYDLDAQKWDEYLSRASFLKMAERFPGQVLEGTNQFVLFIPYDVEKNTVDDAYIPDTDPARILRQNFVGAIKLNTNSGVGGIAAFTPLELDKTIARLSGKRLTPNHVFRNLKNQQTGMEVSPERIETRQVRVR